ncbi:MAG TPA: CapA family protein [Haliangiales bacterium]|nr:CapA family protein [Haliangiales bacterium]
MRLVFVLELGLVGLCAAACSRAAERPAPGGPVVLVGLTGDVMLGRGVNDAIAARGYAYPWGDVRPLLLGTDLNLVNLETTITAGTRAVPKTFNYKAAPDKVQSLVDARIDVVNVANNHILDFSEEGMVETLAVLDRAGIRHVGAGPTQADARRPVIVTRRGVTLGIIGLTDNEPGWEAAEQRAGTNYIEVGDVRRLEEQVAALRDRVDILIVTIHWGPNMRERPTQRFRDLARAAVDKGVDVFHGHSAHVFQGIEAYRGKLILYDTGDFVDDYVVDPALRNDRSLLYMVRVDRSGVRELELVPVVIAHRQVNRAAGEDRDWIIRRVVRLSGELGTEIHVDADRVWVAL